MAEKWKFISLIFSFFYFLRKQFLKKPQKFCLNLTAKYWSIFYRLGHFEILYWGKLCRRKFFYTEKWGNFVKVFITFLRQCFSQLIFWYFQLRLKCIRWNSNENAFLYALYFKWSLKSFWNSLIIAVIT